MNERIRQLAEQATTRIEPTATSGEGWTGEDCSMPNLMYIIRAVEAAHGIGVKQDE